MQFFNFDCYAVLSIDTNDQFDIDPHEPPFGHDDAELRGLWLTRAEAETAIQSLRDARDAKNAASDDELKRKCPWRTWPTIHSKIHYLIVPMANVSVDRFGDLDEALQQAAKLQLAGIGKYLRNIPGQYDLASGKD
jgi:hypothetical protein